MNFLSHFYFDQNNTNPQEVVGAVLPNLLKNANKNFKIWPGKKLDYYDSDPHITAILIGWDKHLTIDRIFHNSDFFKIHTREIKYAISPWLDNSPVRPSFLSHIALEIMLDSLLITENLVKTADFYKKLKEADKLTLQNFLIPNNINPQDFFPFYDNFIKVQYLESYTDLSLVIDAINRICLRIWPQALNDTQKVQLRAVLTDYHSVLKLDFISIFTQISLCLDNPDAP